jgi:hypothetical protein
LLFSLPFSSFPAFSVQALDSAYRASSLASVTSGDGGRDDLTGLNKVARYVRLVFTGKSHPDSGYILKEFAVYGSRLSSLDVGEIERSIASCKPFCPLYRLTFQTTEPPFAR